MAADKITIIVLSGDKKITGFMQAVDMFEPSKVVAEEWTMTANKKKNFDAKKCVYGIRSFLEGEMQQNVAALFIVGYECSAYVNEKYNTISDGKKWFLLSDWLKANGITPRT